MNDPDQQFEEKLKHLVLTPASPHLKSRLARQLGQDDFSSKTRRWWKPANALGIGLAAAAAIVLALGVIFLKPRHPQAKVSRTIGQEQILVGVSEPNLVAIAGAEPMWEIEMRILNRAIIETPGEGRETILVPETRTIFLPAIYQ